MRTYRVRVIVDGECAADPIIIDRYISFYGEVDPMRGIVKPENKVLAGKALIFKGSRGSTVGSYIVYALKYYGKNPACMIVEKAEPILITGCVLADIPLFVVQDYKEFVDTVMNNKKYRVKHRRGEEVVLIDEEGE